MASIIEKKWILKDIWNQVLRDSQIDYYAIYLYGDAPKEKQEDNKKATDKILAVLFKFPTFIEMCDGKMCTSETLNIDGNIIKVVDMRLYLQWVERYYEKDDKEFYGVVFYNPMYQAQIYNRKDLAKAFQLHLDVIAEAMPKIDIYQQLTVKERVALQELYNAIGAEGTISISKLIQQSKKVSRMTFNNLLDALAKYKGATVEAHGVKGTYVHITDLNLLDRLKANKNNN